MKHSVIHSDVTETLKLIVLRLHNLSIKQADGAMGYLGIMLIMRYHDDGGALMPASFCKCGPSSTTKHIKVFVVEYHSIIKISSIKSNYGTATGD